MAGAAFGDLGVPLFVAGALFGDLGASLFVAGAAFGDVGVSLFVAGTVLVGRQQQTRVFSCPGLGSDWPEARSDV